MMADSGSANAGSASFMKKKEESLGAYLACFMD